MITRFKYRRVERNAKGWKPGNASPSEGREERRELVHSVNCTRSSFESTSFFSRLFRTFLRVSTATKRSRNFCTASCFFLFRVCIVLAIASNYIDLPQYLYILFTDSICCRQKTGLRSEVTFERFKFHLFSYKLLILYGKRFQWRSVDPPMDYRCWCSSILSLLIPYHLVVFLIP